MQFFDNLLKISKTIFGSYCWVAGVNLFMVAAHEFGHSLGLSHSSVSESLMYPWYNNHNDLSGDFELSDDDRYGIQQIYGNYCYHHFV